MARRKQAAAEAVQLTPTEETAPQTVQTSTSIPAAEAVQGQPERNAPPLPDVRELKQIKLGPDRDSPRLRLLRSHRFNQMQIRSDEELPQAAREQLQATGWKDRTEEEGIWTKQLPPRPRKGAEDAEPAKPAWRTVVEAERLFHDIANAIRADRGMAPISQEAGR
jgi:hypothetical protein